MLINSVPMSILGKIGFKNFLSPIIKRMYRGIRKALTTELKADVKLAEIEGVAEAAAAETAISEEVIEEVAVEATLSLETGGLAMIGFVALIAVQVALRLLLHPSFHQLAVYNFTDYTLRWPPPCLLYKSEITLEPVINTTGDIPANTLPPMSLSSPSPFITPVNTAAMAEWSVYSDSQFRGVKWGFSFGLYDPSTNREVGRVGAMWDIPLDASNSIGLQPGIPQNDLEHWIEHMEGRNKDPVVGVSLGTSNGKQIRVTNGIDYLHDQHPMSPGSKDKGYIYRSVLVFESM